MAYIWLYRALLGDYGTKKRLTLLSNVRGGFSRENRSTMVHVNPRINRRTTGALGESVAAEFLRRKGFVVIEMNYRKPWGEIDIIAAKGDSVRFVEVKTLAFDRLPDISRENNSYRPEEQVHAAKLRKVMRTAELYMQEKGDEREFQIDVVGVFMDPVRRKARCRLYEAVS